MGCNKVVVRTLLRFQGNRLLLLPIFSEVLRAKKEDKGIPPKKSFLIQDTEKFYRTFQVIFFKIPLRTQSAKAGFDQMTHQTQTKPVDQIPKYRQGTDIISWPEINYTQTLSECETGPNWYKTQSQISYFKTRIQPKPNQ